MSSSPEFSIVSPAEAAQSPYPYVYVNEDGTVRGLSKSEREYLEAPFSPLDSARPYIKDSFGERDGSGSLSGFCLRSQIPVDLPVAPAPAEKTG